MKKYLYGIHDDSEDFSVPFAVELATVLTPMNRCIVAERSEEAADIVQLLEKNSYDQAPIKSEYSPIGWILISTPEYKKLVESNRLTEDNPDLYIKNDVVEFVPESEFSGTELSLPALLECFESRTAAIFYFPSPNSITEVIDGDGNALQETNDIIYVYGILTMSDLNKHSIRRAAYSLFLDIESALSRLIQMQYPESWDWITLLSERLQVRVIGSWELSRMRNVEINPIEVLNLSNLLNIFAKSKSLLAKLEYKPKKQVGSLVNGLIEVRNKIMHPVRPLILCQSDLVTFKKNIDFAIELRSKINQFMRTVD